MTDLKHLEETIAVFGGDTERWPADRAYTLRRVLTSSDGVAPLEEAQALESVLDADADGANVSLPGNDALLARIMAVTMDAPDVSTTTTRAQTRVTGRIATSRTDPRQVGQRGWVAGGLLAASLLIGVIAGVNGFGAELDQRGLIVVQNDNSADDALFADLSFGTDIDLEEGV